MVMSTSETFHDAASATAAATSATHSSLGPPTGRLAGVLFWRGRKRKTPSSDACTSETLVGTCEGDRDEQTGGSGAVIASEQPTTSTRERHGITGVTVTSTVPIRRHCGEPDVAMDAAANMPAITLLAPAQCDAFGAIDGEMSGMETEVTVTSEGNCLSLPVLDGSVVAVGDEGRGVSVVSHDGFDGGRDDGVAFPVLRDGDGGVASPIGAEGIATISRSAAASLASTTASDALMITTQTTTMADSLMMMVSTSMRDAPLITPAPTTVDLDAVTGTSSAVASSPQVAVQVATAMPSANHTVVASSTTSALAADNIFSETMDVRDMALSTSELATDLTVPTLSDPTMRGHHDCVGVAVAHADGSNGGVHSSPPSTHVDVSIDNVATTHTGVVSSDGAAGCSTRATSCSASAGTTSDDVCVGDPHACKLI